MLNILIPTDFSDNAWSAIVYAIKLHEDKLCTFYLLNSESLHTSSLASLHDTYINSIRVQMEAQLNLLKTQLESSDTNINHSFKTVIKHAPLHEAVNNCIDTYNIDLVVMGTKGATGTKALFFGSNTVDVIKKIKTCPILVIPNEYNYKPIKQIVFSTDFNRFYKNEELQLLNNLAFENNAILRVLYIKTEPEISNLQLYNLNSLKTRLKGFETHYHCLPNYNKKAKVISTFIEDLEVDLLIMVKYDHSLIENIINEPIIKTIGFHPETPFLIIPNHKD